MKIYNDFDLTNYNSYRVKSKCKKAFFPKSEFDIVELYKSKIPFILLGSGHNIILSKDYFDTDFVIFNGNYNKILLNNNLGNIEVEAGATMLGLSECALQNSLTGVEIFYDIPSSLGGAVVMNAGASGEEIKDIIIKVRYLDLVDFRVKEINNQDIDFAYRNSFFQKNKNKIVLKAWLKLERGNAKDIRQKMETIKEQRWKKQPKEFPNAGSVFKRPKGFYVGAMIEELGLKGFTIGGAKISEKHAGFIVNFNNATGQDILNIIKETKRQVFVNYGINLKVEQKII